MRLIFMGNPQFAVPALEKLHNSKHEVALVVTSPDRPQGRGRKLCSPAVADYAQDHDLNLIQQENLSEQRFLSKISSIAAAIFIIVAFRILPKELFSIPPKGAVNLHASLLPKYRGAAPIQWALINGETETGLTTFLIEKKVDTGNILLQEKVNIYPEETADELSERMSLIGADLILQTLDLIESGDYELKEQDKSQVTKAPKINPQDGIIDWTQPADKIVNLIRGFSSRPGAFTMHEGRKLKIYKAGVVQENSQSGNPGKIKQIDNQSGIIVETGKGAVQIREVQMEGKKKLACCEFVRGCSLKEGDILN